LDLDACLLLNNVAYETDFEFFSLCNIQWLYRRTLKVSGKKPGYGLGKSKKESGLKLLSNISWSCHSEVREMVVAYPLASDVMRQNFNIADSFDLALTITFENEASSVFLPLTRSAKKCCQPINVGRIF